MAGLALASTAPEHGHLTSQTLVLLPQRLDRFRHHLVDQRLEHVLTFAQFRFRYRCSRRHNKRGGQDRPFAQTIVSQSRRASSSDLPAAVA
jgi:hypothetical protein